MPSKLEKTVSVVVGWTYFDMCSSQASVCLFEELIWKLWF